MKDEAFFRVGDIVTRDGTDRQVIIAVNDSGDLITVRCTQASEFGWCQVGEEEDNLARRYTYPNQVIDQAPRP